MVVSSGDEAPHPAAAVEEWLVTLWSPAADLGLIQGFRRFGPRRLGWHWAALARASRPLLHVAEWEVPLRQDPLLAKAPQLWGEWTCDAPFEQWTIGTESYAAALERPQDALGRAYGVPTPVAWDLEWYATGEVEPVVSGYRQSGVIHGVVELEEGPLDLTEVPSLRWHRWGEVLLPVDLTPARAHVGLRAPFAFPDGTVADWVLSTDGWRSRPAVMDHSPAPGSR